MSNRLGDLFRKLRERAGTFKWLFFGGLALLVLINVFLRPHHPHVSAEHWPGFWALFGLGLAVGMIYVIKQMLSPLAGFSEDLHE